MLEFSKGTNLAAEMQSQGLALVTDLFMSSGSLLTLGEA